MNIKEETKLIGPEGRPLFGILSSPVESFNLSDDFTNWPESIHAKISADGKLQAELNFFKSAELLCCTTRVGLGGFNYTHKEAGIPAGGFISLDGKRWEICEKESIEKWRRFY